MAAKRKSAEAAPGESEVTTSTVRLRKEHWNALRAEAFKRAQTRGTSRPDTSEVLREILDAWIARRR